MAFTTKIRTMRVVKGTATTAEVNAGKTIVEADASRTICVHGGYMIARGGNASGATSVDIKDTADTPVVAVACAVAGLTQDAVLSFDAASNVTNTTRGTGLTAGKGLQIKKTGSNLATATSVDYLVEYTVE